MREGNMKVIEMGRLRAIAIVNSILLLACAPNAPAWYPLHMHEGGLGIGSRILEDAREPWGLTMVYVPRRANWIQARISQQQIDQE
ncbi:hypothetical protein F5Y01DRAFT_313985 [Xylaria sp. FL0043]|nr:hypothetical protein F5Y01DRAFT_313985 [Xylaria sp. FL0043]